MEDFMDIQWLNIDSTHKYDSLIQKVITTCFEKEGLNSNKLSIDIIITNPEQIQKINATYRNIDKPTDVLSFPMLNPEEIVIYQKQNDMVPKDILGDIVISLERVKEQAEEYGHRLERELAYMLVHGFYHLMGYDHIEDKDKKIMREKEESVLSDLHISREA